MVVLFTYLLIGCLSVLYCTALIFVIHDYLFDAIVHNYKMINIVITPHLQIFGALAVPCGNCLIHLATCVLTQTRP